MFTPRMPHLRVAAIALVALCLPGAAAVGQTGPRVKVTFQPDCFRSSLGAACDPRKVGDRLDLGPQIAVWIETASGQYVDTVMVTNLTSQLGIGNRPGHVTLPSGPKFPYGRRPMVLPVWAHKRNKLYDAVVMQDGLDKEYWLGFHEVVSSPDPYYCRPMTLAEIDVDAVTCPTQRFNSVKGRFFDPRTDAVPPHVQADGTPKPYVPPAKSYYPPRNDLRTFVEQDCDRERGAMCTISARQYADLNDLDNVAAATPSYGLPFSRSWRVPDNVPDGNYVVLVEVSKEFDQNASHTHPAAQDPMLREWGIPTNFGQPSVVFKVPFKLDRGQADQQATEQIAGYGDWDGRTGTLHAPDSTISESPGSGVGRLLNIIQQAAGGGTIQGRVHVVTETTGGALPEPPPDAGTGDGGVADGGVDAPVDAPSMPNCQSRVPAGIAVSLARVDAETAQVTFIEPSGPAWERVESYELRRWNGIEQSADAFANGLPLPEMAKSAPGTTVSVPLSNLKSESQYTVGVRARGECLDQETAFASFTTRIREFTQLSGCFIATAAYGSPMAADVQSLRRIRDGLRARSPLAAAAADVYARSSPPLADALRASEAARAVARTLLAPLVKLAK
jgi:hypothetical protein